MATAPNPLTHAVPCGLDEQCRTILLAALSNSARFSIADPKFDRLHVAVYHLYLQGYIARSGEGFSDWKLTEKGRLEACLQHAQGTLAGAICGPMPWRLQVTNDG
mgnify:FL=1